MMFCRNSTRKNGVAIFSDGLFSKERVEEKEVTENDKTDKYS
jgi:predicted outer membrane repeat protein